MPAALRPLLAACLLLAACDSPSESRPVPQTPREWVAENAHVVRSINVENRDFSDLEPLREAIGGARVVMLGEQSHGDGATFRAKARLIAFLHQEMGFDVLIWESGIYDVERSWQQILAGEDVFAATRRGIFAVWSLSQQVRPTLEYVRSTVGTARPLEMAGFDFQLTTQPSSDSMDVQVERFAREIGSSVVNDAAWPSAMGALRNLSSDAYLASGPPPPAQQAALFRLMTTLHDDAVRAGGRRAAWWAQVLQSTRAYAERTWNDPGVVQGSIVRENQMARNAIWLVNEHYRGRKVILWGASLHLARNVEEVLRRVDGTPYAATGGIQPMGGQLYAALGAGQVYSLGFTAARGRAGRFGASAPLAEPMAESLEAYLDEIGMAYAFVDLRSPGPGGEWLTSALMRPFGYAYLRGDWTLVMDGMFYTREMTPSDPVPQ